MGKAVMRIDKLKTPGNITKVYEHNYRINEVSHCDSSKIVNNRELVSLNGLTLNEAIKGRLDELKDTNPKVRKNAVLALEVMTAIPVEDVSRIDVDKWADSQVEWLGSEFNADKEKYGDNVLSVVLHMDESAPHCHGVVIPIDDKGKLNASHYLDGREKMSQKQDSYGAKMSKEFGLERGLKGSYATHEDMKKFHAAVNKAANTTAPLPIKINGRNETAEEYIKRVVEPMVQENSLRELDLQNKIKRLKNERNTIFANEKHEMVDEISQIEELKGLSIDEIRVIVQKAKTMDELNNGIQNYPDKQVAVNTFNNVANIVKFEQERLKEEEENKKKKKKKSEEK